MNSRRQFLTASASALLATTVSRANPKTFPYAEFEQRIAKKQEINEVEARAYMDLRGGLFEERGYGKLTEKALDHAVALEETVRKVHREFATLSSWCNRLEHLMSALQMKIELTRSSEATRRLVEEHTPAD